MSRQRMYCVIMALGPTDLEQQRSRYGDLDWKPEQVVMGPDRAHYPVVFSRLEEITGDGGRPVSEQRTGVASPCHCVEEVNEALKQFDTALVTPPNGPEWVQIETYTTRGQQQPPPIFGLYCPFCGIAYPELGS